MEIVNVKVGSPSQAPSVDIENPSQVNAEIKNVTINTGGGSASNAVLYDPQDLTDEQKQQARANIEAVSQKEIVDHVKGTGIKNIVKLTQSQYDAMASHDANTLYVIEG